MGSGACRQKFGTELDKLRIRLCHHLQRRNVAWIVLEVDLGLVASRLHIHALDLKALNSIQGQLKVGTIDIGINGGGSILGTDGSGLGVHQGLNGGIDAHVHNFLDSGINVVNLLDSSLDGGGILV